MATQLIEPTLDRKLTATLAQTREDLLKARHLPGWLYTSPEIYAREIERIFMKEWLCVGRVEEFEKPGDYLATRIASEPLLICRDSEGALNAFSNVCRHRGVEVATGQGNIKEFSCPYHGWLYGLDGKLIGAPHTKGVVGYDFKQCQLPRVRLETWGGYMFVNFDVNAQSLARYLDEDDIRDFAAFLKPEETRCADRYEFEVDCNWKFIPENLMDMYHVGVIHRTSFGAHFPVEQFKFDLTKYGYHAEYESYTMAPDGESLFGTMPWLEGKKSKFFACTVWLRPTMNVFGRHDLIQPWTCFPVDVNRTRIVIYTQFPKENFAKPAFRQKNEVYKDFIRLVAEEDKAMLRSLQNGVGSRAFRPGPTVGLEKAIHHLLNYYIDRIFGDDAPPRGH